ncbi:MAG TPA: sigma 54-interacting transcriptional regulator [Nitrospinaceae bacterium]|jgi:PAS domain S-box-containing protein|nr:sigma 54-interacting transcriptional regulator [Nitrospinaceae bacterium]HJO01217.1 sigma 54-interacting transcriptional regulator [Nitrospinaceae bacterium]|tara:strand:+ start:551 stop:1879 length:1329 start_codon:yes stop_codon:yes gene_type:complete
MAKTSGNYLNNIFNVLNEAVFIYDQDMEIKYFNDAAEKITGHKREDVLGQQCVTLFDKNLCLNNCSLCTSVKKDASKENVRFESPFTRKDGSRGHGTFQAGLLRKEKDGSLEVLVALTDVSEIDRLKQELKESHSFQNIIGKGPMMRELFDAIRNIAVYDSTILLSGESGTGKELVARAIHHESLRADNKLIKVNCSAFSENLLESELFGHVKGAFTGATGDRMGRFEEACGGTIFLDEISDLLPKVQVKLLRVLQEKEVERVGANVTREVNIRIIAATNKDLLNEVREGRFREDLYYRLNVIPVQLPPLRARKEDIPYLTQHFIDSWKGLHRKKIRKATDSAVGRLMDYHWPGNVRELENAIEHACVKCNGENIKPEDFPAYLTHPLPTRIARKKRKQMTRESVLEALSQTNYNQTQAARLLDLHRITLWRKMKELNITPR